MRTALAILLLPSLAGCEPAAESTRPWGALDSNRSIVYYPDGFFEFVRAENAPDNPRRLQEIDGIPCSYERTDADGAIHVYRLHASEIVIDRESHRVVRWEPLRDDE